MFRNFLSLFLLILFIPSFSLFGQTKFEREYRIKEILVPAPAVSFISACEFSRKVKWYREESLTGESVEAKVKHQKVRYSIEFDTKGNIEDVELKIKSTAIPNDVQSQIKQHLNQTFEAYKFVKIQLQWTGESNRLIELVKGNNKVNNYTTKYEIEIKGKGTNGTHLYEFLFDEKGRFIHQAIIVLRNTDNLDF